MSEEKVPYIKRLENQRDLLIKTLKSVEAYNSAVDKHNNTSYKSDALKGMNTAKAEMLRFIAEAKNTLGGLYA